MCVFPQLLHDEWANYGVFFKYQPVNLIRYENLEIHHSENISMSIFALQKSALKDSMVCPPPPFFGKRSRRILKGSRFNLFLPRSLKG